MWPDAMTNYFVQEGFNSLYTERKWALFNLFRNIDVHRQTQMHPLPITLSHRFCVVGNYLAISENCYKCFAGKLHSTRHDFCHCYYVEQQAPKPILRWK